MKKQILFIMPDLPSGGAEKLLIDILRNFDHKRYAVTLLLEYRQGVYLQDIPSEVNLKTMFKASNIWLERWHHLLHILHCYHLYHAVVHKLVLLFVLRGLKFDTIVSFMEGEAVRLHSYLMGKAKRNVSWVHIDLKTKHWTQIFFRSDKHECRVYEGMDCVVFVSQEAKSKFLELYHIDEKKCCVQYNLIDKESITVSGMAAPLTVSGERLAVSGIKGEGMACGRVKGEGEASLTAHRSPLTEAKRLSAHRSSANPAEGSPLNVPIICMVGRLNPQKRYDRALRVAKRLKEDGIDFTLQILGEGHLEAELKEMARELDIEDRVEWKGFVKPPYGYMQAADIYWNTSEAEGYPLVVCEAVCLGRPVVATAICGTTEILAQGAYGCLTSEKEEDIYQKMKEMLTSETQRQEYAAKALEGAERFDVERVMNDIYTLIG